MSEQRWTKQEFLDTVEPCGYEFRIWWWFLWHRYVTLLNLATAYMTSNVDRLWAIRCLDLNIYSIHLDGRYVFFGRPTKMGERIAKIIVRSIREDLLVDKE